MAGKGARCKLSITNSMHLAAIRLAGVPWTLFDVPVFSHTPQAMKNSARKSSQ
jgi:hypothetical protein